MGYLEFVRRHFGLFARILISGSILGWLVFKVDWTELAARVRAADPAWLAVAVVLAGMALVLAARRWQILLRVHAVDPGFPLLLRVSFIGQFFNAFLLGTTGGDVVKIFYITQAAPEQRSAAGLSVLLDRAVGLAALVTLALACTLPYQAIFAANAAAHRTLGAFYLLAAGVGGALLFASILPWLMRRANFRALEGKIPFHARIERLSDALHRNVRAGRANASAFFLSLFLQGISLVAQWAIARALHYSLPIILLAGITAIIYVLISIPVSVSGLGVRESLFILFLGLPNLGVPAAGAFAISLLGFCITLFWSLAGGLVYLRYRHPLPPEVKTEAVAP
jgi:hypothetical protein